MGMLSRENPTIKSGGFAYGSGSYEKGGSSLMFSFYPKTKTSCSADYTTYSRNNAENRYVRRVGRRSVPAYQDHPSVEDFSRYGEARCSRAQIRHRASEKAIKSKPTQRAVPKHASYQGPPYTTRSFTYQKRSFGSLLQRRGFLIALILTLSLLVIGSMTWCGAQAAKQTIATTAHAHSSQAVSTPKSEWQKGSIPYLYQTDAQWSQTPYGEDRIELSGCGPTCLSMIYIGLTGDVRMDPPACARFAERNNHLEGGATRWSLMEEGAEKLGLISEGVPVSKQAVIEALQKDKPLIMSVAPGDFTSVGHFLVIEALDNEGQLIIHDPNSPQNSSQHWDVERVVRQARGIWAFSI